MLFTSYEFILVLLPLALVLVLGVSALGKWTLAKVALFGVSLVFYAWWNPPYLAFLLAILTFNYAVGSWLIQTRLDAALARRRTWMLGFGVAANIATLVYFKYTNFFAAELGFALAPIVMPLGISFIVFQKIAFLVDAYGSDIKRLSSLDYGVFVTFFPQLISGPIVHHREIIPQLESRDSLRYAARVMPIAISFFVFGAFKKLVIADSLSANVGTAFDSAGGGLHLGFFGAWTSALGYTFQVYFDFSGYSDIAIGLGLMFGVRLPYNFNSPFKATGPIDYWRRWHITLTRFLTAYVYNPLAVRATRYRMARRKKIRVGGVMTVGAFVSLLALPTLFTMFIAGAWHGAGYQFIVFGLIHGVYLVANHGWRNLRAPRDEEEDAPIPRHRIVISRAAMFLGAVIAIPFFRADTVHTGARFTTSMFGLDGFDAHALPDLRFVAILVGCLLATQLLPNTQEILGERLERVAKPLEKYPGEALPSAYSWSWPRVSWKPTVVLALLIGIVGWWVVANMGETTEFLYFQF
ncbi:MAG: MBOAT family protein [Myxococcales bacterium]|nr:MBOAT family protein [Myxococcales bacterium]